MGSYASLGYCDEIATSVGCVRLDRPVPAGLTGEDGLAALAIVLGAYPSSQTGRPVDPRELVAAAEQEGTPWGMSPTP